MQLLLPPRPGSVWDAGGDVTVFSPRCRRAALQTLAWLAAVQGPARVGAAAEEGARRMGLGGLRQAASVIAGAPLPPPP